MNLKKTFSCTTGVTDGNTFLRSVSKQQVLLQCTPATLLEVSRAGTELGENCLSVDASAVLDRCN